jgi:hypothetical protein
VTSTTRYELPAALGDVSFDCTPAAAALRRAQDLIELHNGDDCDVRRHAVYFVRNVVAARDAKRAAKHWANLLATLRVDEHARCANVGEV